MIRSPRQLLTFAAAILAAASATTDPASAGSYTVVACDHAPDGATNQSWTYSESISGRFDHGDGCAAPSGDYSGLYARETFNQPGNVPAGATAYWTFNAPTGTTITRLLYSRYLWTYGDDGWRAETRTNTGALESCQVPPLDELCSRGSAGSGPVLFQDLSATQLRVGVRCEPASPSTTCTDGSTIHRVSAVIYGATVTLTESTAPTAGTVGGTLASGAWVRGTQPVTFNASDATGIKRLELRRAGTTVLVDDKTCDFTRPLPCAAPGASAGADWPAMDTSTWLDGTYTVTGYAVDAADNPSTSAPVTVRVDNHQPGGPVNLTAAGGAAWSPQASRSLSWQIPDGQVAPVTSAQLQLCRQGGSCTTTATSSPTATTVTFPAPGRYTASVWLVDAAGNGSPAFARDVELAYDPDAPNAPALGSPTTGATADEFVLPVNASDAGPAPLEQLQAELCAADGSACGAPFTAASLSELRVRVPGSGSFQLRAWVLDAAGNRSPASTATLTYSPSTSTPPPITPPPTTNGEPTVTATPAPTVTPTPTPTRVASSLRLRTARLTRSAIRLRATARSTASGRVTLTYRVRVGGRTRTLMRRLTLRSGRLVATVRLPRFARQRRGRLTLRYGGDATHQPSTATRTLKRPARRP